MAKAPQLNSEQRRVLQTILTVGRRVGASRKDMIAAVETGLVESGLTNPAGGDGTSQGWRQETASSYPGVNRQDVAGAARRFFNEAKSREGQYRRPGDLAAAVQRPAAQYRGRYAQAGGQARAILSAYGGGGGGGAGLTGGAQFPSSFTQTTTTTPGVDNSAARLAAVQSFLGSGGVKNSNALLQFASVYPTLKDTAAKTTTSLGGFKYAGGGGGSPAGGTSNALVDQIKKKVGTISSFNLPYQWGGGHQGKVKNPHTPVDCSGFVSEVFGINPLVASQFATWGKAGKGQRVTIWAAKDGSHVLMEVDGHFAGTSGSRPGGGAGWIKGGVISKAYLRNFVPRHPNGL